MTGWNGRVEGGGWKIEGWQGGKGGRWERWKGRKGGRGRDSKVENDNE